jgi:ABC-type antimicrobial peptide transport system permease subunit
MNYAVNRRTGEIGLRMALGATKQQIRRMIVRETFVLIGIGLIVGIPVSIGAARFIASELYSVRPGDPLTTGAVCMLLAAIAVMAALLPARRAARVDPMVALRYE